MNKNSLTDLFTFEEDKVIEKPDDTVLIFDGHNLAFKTVFASAFQEEDDDDFKLWKHKMMTSIFYTINKFEPSKVIFAFDGKRSWRYNIYPEYKANRKAARAKQKQTVDFEAWYPVFNKFVDEMREYFSNMYVLQIPECEADDVMAVLSRDVFGGKDIQVINVTSDSDLHQLMAIKNVDQYDGKKLVKCLNPEKKIELKVIEGDSSDNIKGIRRGVGPATAEKVFKVGVQEFIKQDTDSIISSKDVAKAQKQWPQKDFDGMIIEDVRKWISTQMKENYKLNTQLIKFDHIPQEIKTRILNTYTEYETKELDGKEVIKFFTKNKMMRHLNEWNRNADLIKSLR